MWCEGRGDFHFSGSLDQTSCIAQGHVAIGLGSFKVFFLPLAVNNSAQMGTFLHSPSPKPRDCPPGRVGGVEPRT